MSRPFSTFLLRIGWAQLFLALLTSGCGHDPSPSELLLKAVKEGDTELVKAYLNSGVDVNAAAGGRTALTLAASHDEPVMVALLLSRGANPNARSVEPEGTSQCTPLECAFTLATEVNARLLEAGADPNLYVRHPPLIRAISGINSNVELVRLLLKHHANPNVTSEEGKTAAEIAMNDVRQFSPKGIFGGAAILKLLLEAGATSPPLTEREKHEQSTAAAVRHDLDAVRHIDLDPYNVTFGNLRELFTSKPTVDHSTKNATRLSWCRGAVAATFYTPTRREVSDSERPIELEILPPLQASIHGIRLGMTVDDYHGWDAGGLSQRSYYMRYGSEFEIFVREEQSSRRIVKVFASDNRYSTFPR